MSYFREGCPEFLYSVRASYRSRRKSPHNILRKGTTGRDWRLLALAFSRSRRQEEREADDGRAACSRKKLEGREEGRGGVAGGTTDERTDIRTDICSTFWHHQARNRTTGSKKSPPKGQSGAGRGRDREMRRGPAEQFQIWQVASRDDQKWRRRRGEGKAGERIKIISVTKFHLRHRMSSWS